MVITVIIPSEVHCAYIFLNAVIYRKDLNIHESQLVEQIVGDLREMEMK